MFGELADVLAPRRQVDLVAGSCSPDRDPCREVVAVPPARAAHRWLLMANAPVVVMRVQGTYLPCRGIAQRPGRWTRNKQAGGPPDVRAAGGLPDRRDGFAGRRAPPGREEGLVSYRRPDQRRIKPQNRGFSPGFDLLSQSRMGDAATASVLVGGVAPTGGWGVLTGAGRAVPQPLVDPPLAQDCEPRVPIIALIDNRLAIGETDGWHQSPGRPGLAAHPAISGPGRARRVGGGFRRAGRSAADLIDPSLAGPLEWSRRLGGLAVWPPIDVTTAVGRSAPETLTGIQTLQYLNNPKNRDTRRSPHASPTCEPDVSTFTCCGLQCLGILNRRSVLQRCRGPRPDQESCMWSPR